MSSETTVALTCPACSRVTQIAPDRTDPPNTARVSILCDRCDTTEGVKMESSRTQYPFKGKVDDPENPNRDVPLCRVCAKEHHDHWDERWADYRAGLL